MLKNLLHIQNIGTMLPKTNIFRHIVQFPASNGLSTSAVKKFAQSATEEGTVKAKTTKKRINPFAHTSNSFQKPSINNELSESEQDIAELSPEKREKQLKVLQLELDIASQGGRRVPSLDFLKDSHWQHVLSLPSRSARYKYYQYLWQIEMKNKVIKMRQPEKSAAVKERVERIRRERAENTHIVYGLSHTTLFLRFYDSTINHWQNNRLTRAMQFSPKLVMDCSYDEHMNQREAINTAKQLMLSFAGNRANDDPYDMHYCNVNMDTPCMRALKRYVPTMLNPEFPMNVHTKCFTELFPKENLVYLTPHCRNDLVKYNPDDVYIIGAMVDKVNQEPVSLAKAKRLGLRMARLPLDRYLEWGSGSGKSLTINQMVDIMLDLKKTGDWNQALRHVPRRKLFEPNNQKMHERQVLEERADQLNVRIGKKFDYLQGHRFETTNSKIHTHKKNMEFNLNTWASKGKPTQR